MANSITPYNYRWQKARAQFLREHPLCVEHMKLGEVVAASVVDHVLPHHIEDARFATVEQQRIFWDRSNWQSLCKVCHDSYKKKLEMTGLVAGCDETGLPLDANHHWKR